MKRDLKWMTIASASVIMMGIVGCGGGGDVAAEIPSYAKKVDVNQTVAEKAMSMLSYRGVAGMVPKKMATYSTASPAEDSNITENCEYNGTHTTTISHNDDTDNGISSSTHIYSFNHCIHNVPLGSFKIKIYSSSSERRYYHNGMITYDQTKTTTNDENNTIVDLNYKEYTYKRYYENGDLLVEDSQQSGSFLYDTTQKSTKTIFVLTEDYTKHVKSYDKASGILVTDKTTVSEDFTSSTVSIGDQRTITYNGYISTSYENNSSMNKYLYMKDFVTMYQYDSGLTNESYNGTVGSSCFGGAIDIETTLQWDGNQSLEEIPSIEVGVAIPQGIAIVIPYRTKTPYAGETVIKGLNSQVTIKFGQNDENQTYGQFVYEDGTTSDPMRRSDMQSEECGSDGLKAIPVK